MVNKWSTRYLKKAHKFGVRLPKSVDKAYNIDAQNFSVLWNNSIAKQMTVVKISFKFLSDGEDVPIVYAYVHCHIIFDVKMENFCRKARLFSGGHITDTPASMT